MKKITLVLIGIFFSIAAFSQYYYLPSINAGENPGSLHEDIEVPKGSTGAPTGWATILSGPKTIAAWSSVSSIPFTFQFNGQTVSSYIASSTGVVTFTTSATAVPSKTNESLPSANIPDNSICIWGMYAADGDNIMTKTFGSAPNRQHWIQFNSFSEDGIKDGWTYWSIVFEETTNNIYIVDQKTLCVDGGNACTGDVTLTAGIQIDATTAIQVTASPNLISNAENDYTVADNSYYTFFYGTQPDYDLAAIKLDMKKIVTYNTNVYIKGTLKNLGAQTITSFDLNYQIGNGAVITSTINASITNTYDFTAPSAWKPSNPGEKYTIKVWADNLNGSHADMVNENDTISIEVFTNEGNTGTKQVLVEEATGAWCGYCPDGALQLRLILENNPDAVGVSHHNGDGMSFTDGNAINAAYAVGYPTGYVDRVKFDEFDAVGFSRNRWEEKVIERLAEATPINISVKNLDYNTSTRKFDLDVEVDFVDYYYGDLRLTVMLIENYVVGSGSQYDQRNYYSKDGYAAGGSSHLLYDFGDPITNYPHQHTSREFLSATWGDPLNSTPKLYTTGDKFNKTYSTTLSSSYNENHVEFIILVSHYNDDILERSIINVIEKKLTTVSIDEPTMENSVSIYPNPVGSIANVGFSVTQKSDVSLTVYNTMGQTVKRITERSYATGKHSIYFSTSDLAIGTYLAVVKINGIAHTVKFIK